MPKNETVCKIDVRNLQSATAWGTGGPEFKSRRSDQISICLIMIFRHLQNKPSSLKSFKSPPCRHATNIGKFSIHPTSVFANIADMAPRLPRPLARSLSAPRTEPYRRLSRIRLPPRVCDCHSILLTTTAQGAPPEVGDVVGKAIARPGVEDDRFG
jgi:hypothetical protein